MYVKKYIVRRFDPPTSFQKGNKTKYNLVSETLVLLDVICGSTTGGLGLLGLYINENNVALINQILETLTEYCQVMGTY
jgi:inositol 1,4,5-triphosphate receptor type 1